MAEVHAQTKTQFSWSSDGLRLLGTGRGVMSQRFHAHFCHKEAKLRWDDLHARMDRSFPSIERETATCHDMD